MDARTKLTTEIADLIEYSYGNGMRKAERIIEMVEQARLGRETSPEIAAIAAELMKHEDERVRRVAASALGQAAV
ncbi:hypothetical protein JL101_035395 (plasmid) [Skermanella rosea]|uniref:hypothetical protein n=1 Tax=Skermanella rosea TaxID=1817965 RepID=UPI001933EB64|nr:hypothetical protein [Skermanella rosea]UEM08084.1 hypothetical protein JL101_035395 [Skermanella rosea]